MAIEDWSDDEFRMFEDLNLPAEARDDVFVQLAYDMAMFSPEADYETHIEMRRFLRNHLEDEYGFDFEAEFDWEEYRLAGESNA